MEQKKRVPKRRFNGFVDEWKTINWRDAVEISTNMVNPRKSDYADLYHIGPGNIESFTGRLLNNIIKVKDSNLISGKFHFFKNDIIYGKINPQLAKYTMAKSEGLASADAYILNGKNGIEQQFLYYIIQTNDFYKYTVSVSSRTGMPKVNREELNVYNFNVPERKEQQKIGDFFKKLDDMITIQQRKLEKTKALKSAYLAEMFPAEGERLPKRRFAGFTDEWEKWKLGNLAEIVRGASPRPIQEPKWFDKKSNIGWLRISDVTEQNGRINYLEQRLSKLGQEKTRVLNEPHLLLSIAATVGKPVVNYVKTGVHDGFLIFMNPKFDREFMFQWLEMFRPMWNKYGQPGSQINLNSEIVKGQIIVVPNLEEQKKIGAFFKSIDTMITNHHRKLEKLQALKQAYLHEMFV
ncbi:restriction endonuclease subunit S [Virgibacillus dokdonensis]|uniref:restriction endonuclease subunit S n=1 Tax=Virgibacillus dokdonensis TaxID=302167 RepID=UPI00098B8501|nr:restriction endonuclease subunit S [Virgibacillus dokdonensis]